MGTHVRVSQSADLLPPRSSRARQIGDGEEPKRPYSVLGTPPVHFRPNMTFVRSIYVDRPAIKGRDAAER